MGYNDDAQPAAVRLDLRRITVDDVVDAVEKALDTRLNRATAVVKRRSMGFASDRSTWVRIECRGLERLDGQGWGLEAAHILPADIPRPAWRAGLSWFDPARHVVWRADETDLADGAAIGRAAHAAGLSEAWWTELDTVLDALDVFRTPRQATPDCELISASRIAAEIAVVLPGVDATVPGGEWTTAHADFTWQNLTGPTLSILDWEDFGTAPRGLDAARLWFASLSVPQVAERVLRRPELDSRTGRLMMLWQCAQLLAWADEDEPVYAEAKRATSELASQLTTR